MAATEWELPQLKTVVKTPSTSPYYGVQFYPYSAPGVDPVFAVTGGRDTLICRPVHHSSTGFKILKWLRDDDAQEELNSCAWTRDLHSGDPRICLAGSRGIVKILNPLTGDLDKAFVGHGNSINDLAVSPVLPSILASASEDRSVRLWSLDGKHEKQPCAAICAGEGHREAILTIAFHSNGRYLLSGGMDCIINMWVLPPALETLAGSDKPPVLHYPHFSTSAIHSDYVDCISFHGDLVLSKCAREDKIVLWCIEGFSSDDPILLPEDAPTTHESRPTRSAFGSGYQRLLQFQLSKTDPFYMRFGLFDLPNKHPVLAMGNGNSKISFWDLARLEAVADRSPSTGRSQTKATTQREASVASSSSNNAIVAAQDRRSSSSSLTTKKRVPGDPYALIPAHKSITISKIDFCARQAAWSVGGEWLVVVGEHRVISVFGRWG